MKNLIVGLKLLSFMIMLTLTSNLFAIVGTEFGMSDSGVSYPQTAWCPRYNPAGIALVGNRWDVELMSSINRGRASLKGSSIPLFNTSSSTTAQDWQPYAIAGICGYVTPNICLGLSLDATRSFIHKTTKNWPIFGLGKQKAEAEIPIVVPTIAWKINDCHQIGLSIPVFFARTSFSGLQNLEQVSETPSAVTNRGHDYAYGVSVRAGWLWQINPCLTFGVMYAPRLLAASHFHKYRGEIPLKGKLEVPNNLYTGLTYQWGNWTFTTQYDYTWYRQERTLSNSPTSPHLFGSRKGPALGWHNVSILHFAAEYRFSECFLLQGGYAVQIPPLVNKSNANANGVLYTYFLPTQTIDVAATWDVCGYDLTLRYIRFLSRTVSGPAQDSLFGGHIKSRFYLNGFSVRLGTCF